jgi:hypothetical protein
MTKQKRDFIALKINKHLYCGPLEKELYEYLLLYSFMKNVIVKKNLCTFSLQLSYEH